MYYIFNAIAEVLKIVSESMNDAVKKYLDLMDWQRQQVFVQLADISVERLWQRPAQGEWSIGEILDHTRVLNRSFRRIFGFVWLVMMPIGYLLRNKPYETEIDDVYARPGFPMNVGWLWAPKHRPHKPVSLEQMEQETTIEHLKIRQWYECRDEKVLGHIKLYDPAIGWINLVQALRIGVYHDALHYRDIEAMIL